MLERSVSPPMVSFSGFTIHEKEKNYSLLRTSRRIIIGMMMMLMTMEKKTREKLFERKYGKEWRRVVSSHFFIRKRNLSAKSVWYSFSFRLTPRDLLMTFFQPVMTCSPFQMFPSETRPSSLLFFASSSHKHHSPSHSRLLKFCHQFEIWNSTILTWKSLEASNKQSHDYDHHQLHSHSSSCFHSQKW